MDIFITSINDNKQNHAKYHNLKRKATWESILRLALVSFQAI